MPVATPVSGLLGLAGCRGISVCIYNPDLDHGAAAQQIAQYVADAAQAMITAPC